MDERFHELAAPRLQALLDSISEAVVELNAEGRIVSMNRAAERLIGCSESSARGDKWRERWRFLRDHRPRPVEIDAVEPRDDEWLFSPAQSLLLQVGDRTPLPVEVTYRTIRDASGERAGLMLAMRDLGERPRGGATGAGTGERAQQALRESEERLDRLANALPSFVWSATPDGTITWSNARWYEYTGRAAESGKNWFESVHPDDRERCRQAWTAAVQNGSEYFIDVRHRRDDGVYRWFHTRATPVRDAQNRISSWFGSSTDINDLKHAEEARRDSEERLRFALSAAALGEWEIDLKTGQARTSLEHDRCFGFSEPISGWSTEKFFAAVHPDDRNEVRQIVRAAREAGQVCQFECRVIWPDGSTHWIEAHSTIYPGPDGRPSHVAGIVRDITKRKEAEAALREAYRQRDVFLANVSHEIRNPMASLMGYAQLLSERLKDPADLEFVRIIKNSGEYLLALINDLLDLAKMEAGKLEIVREPTPLVRLFNEVHTLMASRARDKGLRLSLRLEGSLPDSVETDPTRLRQVLINLIGNAIKFTERGAVDLIARYDAESALLELEVADTGIGVVPEAQRRLFEPFSQLAGTAALRQGGSGLGLAITRQLVDLMGGTIACESEPDKGSRFRVSLPAAVTSGEISAPPGSASPLLPPHQRVLLVEDREEFGYLLRHHLESAGAEVVSAADTAKALETFRQADEAGRPFAVVIVEMQMSGGDGYETVRQLRAASASTPILALTASTFEADTQQCYSAGCDACLLKPFEAELLLETVAQWCTRRSHAEAEPKPPAQSLNILLIDDNRVTCRSMGMLLEMGGHRVQIAYDGQSALTIAQNFRPDVVVSDVKLPDMDGFSLMRALRELGGMEKTKFIALSGYAESEFRGAEPRFHHFLQKPLKVEDLENLLSQN